MNEEPKNIWKKSWKGPRLFLIWLFLLIATLAIFSIGVLLIGKPFTELSDWGTILAFGAISASLLFALWLFIRWLCCWRNFKRFLFGLACFVTLIALFYAGENWRGKHDWEKFKREWEAKGERFDRASVVPPAIPDDQNFALAPVVASSYLHILDKSGHRIVPQNTNVINRLAMAVGISSAPPKNGIGNWQKAIGIDLKVWQQYYRGLAATTNLLPVAPQPQSPAADVLLALSKYDPTIAELRQAARLPDSRFPLEYDKEEPNAMLLPHLAVMKGCAQVLQLRALAALENGQSDQALADIKLLMRLVDSLRTEPILISHLVRIAIVNLALQPVWEGLMDRRWSDAQLSELDQALAKLDFLPDYKLSMRGEMVLCQIETIDYLRRHPEQISNMSSDGDSTRPAPAVSISHLIPGGWFYQNQLRCARMVVEQFLPLADLERRTISPSSVRHASAANALEFKHVGPYNRLEALLLPAFGAPARRFANAQESADLAQVAIALERYRLAHGEYPETLDALAPRFIAKLPHDIINGQPLHYRRTSDGLFVLYSIGWNEADDGGEVGLSKSGTVNVNTGDWVWRYPAR